MLSTGPGTSRCLGATSWPTERVKQTAQPVRLRVRNLLLETAFLNTTELGWVLLSDSTPRLCFITDSSLASSFYKAHPGAPAPPLITAAAGLKTTSEDDGARTPGQPPPAGRHAVLRLPLCDSPHPKAMAGHFQSGLQRPLLSLSHTSLSGSSKLLLSVLRSPREGLRLRNEATY